MQILNHIRCPVPFLISPGLRIFHLVIDGGGLAWISSSVFAGICWGLAGPAWSLKSVSTPIVSTDEACSPWFLVIKSFTLHLLCQQYKAHLNSPYALSQPPPLFTKHGKIYGCSCTLFWGCGRLRVGWLEGRTGHFRNPFGSFVKISKRKPCLK